jgi:hypothetical protein
MKPLPVRFRNRRAVEFGWFSAAVPAARAEFPTEPAWIRARIASKIVNASMDNETARAGMNLAASQGQDPRKCLTFEDLKAEMRLSER